MSRTDKDRPAWLGDRAPGEAAGKRRKRLRDLIHDHASARHADRLDLAAGREPSGDRRKKAMPHYN